jgi:hypothetical protein
MITEAETPTARLSRADVRRKEWNFFTPAAFAIRRQPYRRGAMKPDSCSLRSGRKYCLRIENPMQSRNHLQIGDVRASVRILCESLPTAPILRRPAAIITLTACTASNRSPRARITSGRRPSAVPSRQRVRCSGYGSTDKHPAFPSFPCICMMPRGLTPDHGMFSSLLATCWKGVRRNTPSRSIQTRFRGLRAGFAAVVRLPYQMRTRSDGAR